MFNFSLSYIALWALVVFQGLLALALVRQVSELRERIRGGELPAEEPLPEGSKAPAFTSKDLRSGNTYTARSLQGRGGLLLFFSSDCQICKTLATALQQVRPDRMPITLAFGLGREQALTRFSGRLPDWIPLLLQDAGEISQQYRISTTPTAVLVDGKLQIRGYSHPGSAAELLQFAERALESDPKPARPALLANVSGAR
jgi:thioredoxin-related protein